MLQIREADVALLVTALAATPYAGAYGVLLSEQTYLSAEGGELVFR